MATTKLELPIPVKQLRDVLRAHGVIEASVFGSYARGEQTQQSDLDLFVRCKPGVSLFDVFDLQSELEQATGVTVEVVTKLNKHFAPYIEPELVKVL